MAVLRGTDQEVARPVNAELFGQRAAELVTQIGERHFAELRRDRANRVDLVDRNKRELTVALQQPAGVRSLRLELPQKLLAVPRHFQQARRSGEGPPGKQQHPGNSDQTGHHSPRSEFRHTVSFYSPPIRAVRTSRRLHAGGLERHSHSGKTAGVKPAARSGVSWRMRHQNIALAPASCPACRGRSFRLSPRGVD